MTVYRAIRPLFAPVAKLPQKHPIALGPQPETVHGARVFVLPNPSGRNANFTYEEMLEAFTALRGLSTAGGQALGLRLWASRALLQPFSS